MSQESDWPEALPAGLNRRQFLGLLAALGGGFASPRALRLLFLSADIIECEDGPTANGDFFSDRDNWKRHGLAHFINVLWPGDNGSLAFVDDVSPFNGRLPQVSPGDDPPDSSPSAYAACAIDALFDPFYTFDSEGGGLALVSALDWWSRLLACGPAFYFHEAGWAQQIRVIHGVETRKLAPLQAAWGGAWLLIMATALGAAYNYSVTNDIGWPGPANHYYHGTAEGSHPNDGWLRPAAATGDGNLP